MSDYREVWQALADAAEPGPAVRRHLDFLAGTDDCPRLLDRLVAQLKRVEVTKHTLNLVFQYVEYDDEECVVECGPPYDGPAEGVPASMLPVCRVHNGIGWLYLGGGGMGFNGLDEGYVVPGGWEAEALTDAAEENAEFLSRLASAGLGIDDVESPADYGQNWLIWDPVERNALGEPVLYFVSHGDCVAVRVDSAKDLAFGPLVIRIMAQDILGEELLDEVYS